MRMRNIIVPYATSPAVQYFTLSHKRHDFRKKILLNVKCVLIFVSNISYFKKN